MFNFFNSTSHIMKFTHGSFVFITLKIKQELSSWLVVLRIYVAVLQPHRDLEAGDNQSLKS